MKRKVLFHLIATATLAAWILPASSFAQDEEANEPGRGVARLSLMNGDVSVRRGDSGDWLAGAINAPLLAEDRVATGPNARAEVQFDYYHRIRIAPDSEIRIAELDSKRYTIQLARGTATFTALAGGDAQVEISTPGAAVRPVDYGNYRVTVQPDGTAQITVRSGEAEIYTPAGTQRLKSGNTMEVRLGPNNTSEFQMLAAIPRDSWDEFNENRDRELDRGKKVYAQQYVSRDVYGAEDLYGHGDWVYVAPYGWSWRPYVAVGWAPYRYGRWSWMDYYGWSWVSYDPWGWAPYHYGRWYVHGGAWYWYPGAVVGVHHYWSPGIVAWFGWSGGGFGVGVGFGGGYGRWGWCPVAPFEPYHRWWGGRYYHGYRGGNYVQNNVKIVNNVNITNVYRNARHNNAVTVVDGGDFSRGMTGRAYRASASDLGRANLVQGPVPVAPTRESLRFSDRQTSAARSNSLAPGNERFYSRREVARVDRVPFEQQRSALQGLSGRDAGTNQGVRVSSADTRSSGLQSREQSSRGEAQSGWRSFGDAGSAGNRTAAGEADVRSGRQGLNTGARTTERGMERTQAMETERQSDAPRSGWRSFGDPSGSGRSTAGAGEGDVRSGRASTGWRSFGDPSGTSRATTGGGEGDVRSGRASTGWRSIGESGSQSNGNVRIIGGDPGSDGPRSAGSRSESSGGGRGVWSTYRGDTRGMESTAPRSSGSGGWSTGSRESIQNAPRGSYGGGERGTWSSGGGVDRGRSSGGTIRSAPGYESPRGGGDGGFGTGSRSIGSPSMDRGGSRSAPSWSAPPSMGGSRGGSIGNRGSFGGGSGSIGGGMSGGPSGGGARSAPSGGGRSGGSVGGGAGSRGGGGAPSSRGGGRR